MASNYRQKSGSSGLRTNKRRSGPEREHKRSARQVRPVTPRVFDSPAPLGASARGRRGAEGPEEAGEQSGYSNAPGSRSGGRTTQVRSSRSQRSAGTGRTSSRTSRTSRSAGRGMHPLTKRLIIGLVVAVVVIGGAVAVYNSSLFTINHVSVSGNEKLRSDYVLTLAAVPEDSTFLRTDVDGIVARLATEPWIKNVEVQRNFPDTIVLSITEQPVTAVVDIVPVSATDPTSQWIIASDSTWVSAVEAEHSGLQLNPEVFARIPRIKDVSAAVRPEAGTKESDEGIINALTILEGVSADLRSMIATISAPDAVKTTLSLYNNVSVAFGVAEDLSAKERAIATLLDEHQGTITSINVRVADRATYRATE